MAEESAQELDLEIGGQKVRAKGYRMLDILWGFLAIGVTYCSITLYQREALAQTEKAAISKALIDSNAAVANTLKESNAAMVQAIKESNQNTVRALDRNTEVTREIACLSDPLMRNRSDAREFCKRMSRNQ